MLEEDVLLKTNSSYSINPNWVEQFRKKADHFTEKFKKEKEIDLENMKEGQSINLSFNGILDLGWFLIDKAMDTPNPENKSSLALWRLCYSVVGLEEKHLTGLKKVFKQNDWFIRVEENNEVDKLFGETLKSYGAKEIKFGITGCSTKLSDKIIVGDYITELIYDPTFRKLWSIQNKLPKKVVEFGLGKHLYLMREYKGKMDAIVTKNSSLADEYRKEYLRKQIIQFNKVKK
ncbi:MAG: hypothetical protein ABIH20_06565 [Candidatus Diapherotrites archaeon]